MTRYVAKVYRVEIADSTPAANIETVALNNVNTGNLILTGHGKDKEELAQELMRSGNLDKGPDNPDHRI
jgi:hypothetical protein